MTTSAEPQYRLFTFKLSPADHAELEQLAKQNERTVSAEARLAVRAYLIAKRTEVAA